ncbi:sulfotransferase [Pelagibius litoralis]|uniref:Sulfotransferase n=2 Tax=Pelagibius litoralis TaxID=374515 RepID=A0A967C4Y7_9PROT|nr:sulfotransferase [Pelagibius litoralis]
MRSAATEDRYAGFRVTPWVHHCGRFVARHRDFWIRLGEGETRLRADDIAETTIDRPIFVSGLARSGTTILLEVLARHRDVASHRYKDYPFLFTPFLWNRFLKYMPQKRGVAVERSHADGIAVSPDSPEAFEEVLWMAFFEGLHDPAVRNVLDAATDNPAFERFYGDHIRKLLTVRSRARYLAKANYNVTRLEYLLKVFPDARFVLPLRAPVGQIASLVKQHRLFCEGERRHPRALDHMRRIGHFEFGLDRRPVNVGDGAMDQVLAAWDRGAEAEGWAIYWASLHGYLADRLAANPALAAAVKVVRFEDLCNSPFEVLGEVCAHCRLPDSAHLVAEAAELMRMPSYYRPDFTEAELARIDTLAAPVARRFGYADAVGL